MQCAGWTDPAVCVVDRGCPDASLTACFHPCGFCLDLSFFCSWVNPPLSSNFQQRCLWPLDRRKYLPSYRMCMGCRN